MSLIPVLLACIEPPAPDYQAPPIPGRFVTHRTPSLDRGRSLLIDRSARWAIGSDRGTPVLLVHHGGTLTRYTWEDHGWGVGREESMPGVDLYTVGDGTLTGYGDRRRHVATARHTMSARPYPYDSPNPELPLFVEADRHRADGNVVSWERSERAYLVTPERSLRAEVTGGQVQIRRLEEGQLVSHATIWRRSDRVELVGYGDRAWLVLHDPLAIYDVDGGREVRLPEVGVSRGVWVAAGPKGLELVVPNRDSRYIYRLQDDGSWDRKRIPVDVGLQRTARYCSGCRPRLIVFEGARSPPYVELETAVSVVKQGWETTDQEATHDPRLREEQGDVVLYARRHYDLVRQPLAGPETAERIGLSASVPWQVTRTGPRVILDYEYESRWERVTPDAGDGIRGLHRSARMLDDTTDWVLTGIPPHRDLGEFHMRGAPRSLGERKGERYVEHALPPGTPRAGALLDRGPTVVLTDRNLASYEPMSVHAWTGSSWEELGWDCETRDDVVERVVARSEGQALRVAWEGWRGLRTCVDGEASPWLPAEPVDWAFARHQGRPWFAWVDATDPSVVRAAALERGEWRPLGETGVVARCSRACRALDALESCVAWEDRGYTRIDVGWSCFDQGG